MECLLALSAATTLLFSCASNRSFAQTETAGVTQMIAADFDGDARNDTFFVEENSEGEARLKVKLGTKKNIISGTFSDCCSAITLRGKSVRLTSKGMRGFAYYTFRWNPKADDFQLIGYDTESFGNAMNDGSGTSSLNLLNGSFLANYNVYNIRLDKLVALSTVRKKIIVRRAYYLRDFSDASEEQIRALAHDNNPKAVR